MMRSILFGLFALFMPAQAWAATCQTFDLNTLMSQVPYFSNRMSAVSQEGGAFHLVHNDDPSIQAAFNLQTVAPAPVGSRTDFLASLQQRLDAEVALRNSRGTPSEQAIFPYDPITWTIISRDNQRNVQGLTTIRLGSECNLVANWGVIDTPAMAGRIAEFQASLDALRTFSERHIDPTDGFVVERLIPSGISAMLVGFAAPLMGAIALMLGLKHMIMLGRPGIGPRVGAGIAGAIAAGALTFQMPIYMQNMEGLVYIDNAALLVLLLGLNLPAAVLGSQKAILSAMTVTTIAGLTLGLSAALQWVPDTGVGFGMAGGFILVGIASLALWQHEATTAVIGRKSARSV